MVRKRKQFRGKKETLFIETMQRFRNQNEILLKYDIANRNETNLKTEN